MIDLVLNKTVVGGSRKSVKSAQIDQQQLMEITEQKNGKPTLRDRGPVVRYSEISGFSGVQVFKIASTKVKSLWSYRKFLFCIA